MGAEERRWTQQPWLRAPGLELLDLEGAAVRGSEGVDLMLGPQSEGRARVEATLQPSQPGELRLDLPWPAARTRVEVEAPGLDVERPGQWGGWLQPGPLVLRWSPAQEGGPPPEPPPLVLAEERTLCWAEEGSLRVRSRLRFKVQRGEQQEFRARLSGLEELSVSGPGLESWRMEGQELVLRARAPVKGALMVDIEGRRALGPQGVAVPRPTPLGVLRTEHELGLGKADEGELIPETALRAVPLRQLSTEARGLSERPLMAAWTGPGELVLRAARFEPLAGPETVVERAELTVVQSEEGRLLVRTVWRVRNERAPALRVVAPPGWVPMTARVAGEAVPLTREADGTLRVPLQKSVETVKGLMAVAVELSWTAEGAAFEKGERQLRLPAVLAPIQSAQWTVVLPRGWRQGRRGGLELAAAEEQDAQREMATSATNQALRAWQSNDFEAAAQYLDLARSYGGEDEDVERLQSNLDVLSGKADSGGSAERRVRELANAKTLDAQNEQLKAEEEAKQALRAGDERSAQEALGRASGYARSIALTEQKESEEQKDRIAAYDAQIEVLAKKKEKPAPSRASSSTGSSSSGSKGGPSYRRPTEIDFEGIDISGELTLPQGAMAQTAPAPAPAPAPPPLPMPAPPAEAPRPASNDLTEELFGGVAEAGPESNLIESDDEPTQVLEKEFLERIPTGRSYQSAVQMAPGVATHRARPPRPERAERRRDRDEEAPAAGDSPIATAAHGSLTVEASAFTPALPLDAPTLSAAQALLPAGAFPTLTLHVRPERRSDGEAR